MKKKLSLVTVLEASSGKQVELTLRGGTQLRGVIEEVEPDMSLFLKHLEYVDKKNDSESQFAEGCCFDSEEPTYIRGRNILFISFPVGTNIVQDADRLYHRRQSLGQTRRVVHKKRISSVDKNG